MRKVISKRNKEKDEKCEKKYCGGIKGKKERK